MTLTRLSLFALLLAILALFSTSAPAARQIGILDSAGDVGDVTHRGRTEVDRASGAYTLSGSGAGVGAGADAFYFASRRLAGEDVVLTADVAFVDEGGGARRMAGLMVRASREAGAVFADAVLHGDGRLALRYRARRDGPTMTVETPLSGPATLRLARHGEVISVEAKRSGGAFQPVGAIVLQLPEKFEAGLFVCAGDANRVERARFSNVAVEPIAAAGKRIIESTLETIHIPTGERRIVHRERRHFEAPNWSHDGKTFLVNSGGLLYTIPVEGGALTKLDTGSISGCNNDHGYSPDATRIALSCGTAASGGSRVYVMPVAGGEPRLLTPLAPSYWHGWSPDGRLLAYVARRDGEFDIYTMPVEGGAETRLTTAKGLDDGPDYTPDGQWIYFNSVRTGAMRIWRMRPDGSGQEQITDDAAYGDWFPHPSPDGKWIVFVSFEASVEGHPPNKPVVLRLMPAAGGAPKVIAHLFGGQGTLNVPSWSPDSTRVAFVSYRLVY